MDSESDSDDDDDDLMDLAVLQNQVSMMQKDSKQASEFKNFKFQDQFPKTDDPWDNNRMSQTE